jgi:hypothetical protein
MDAPEHAMDEAKGNEATVVKYVDKYRRITCSFEEYVLDGSSVGKGAGLAQHHNWKGLGFALLAY